LDLRLAEKRGLIRLDLRLAKKRGLIRFVSARAFDFFERLVYAETKHLRKMKLTSTKNPLLQSIRRAAAQGRPTEDGLIVVEGPHLLEEALRGAWRIEQVFATPGALERHADLLSRTNTGEIVEVSARAFQSMAGTETTQELLVLLRPRAWNWDDLIARTALLVLLDTVQDPGNAGTIVRSAEAFGATGVILLKSCVRVANGKFVRATAGSIFRVPFLEAWEASEFVARARHDHLRLYALAAAGGGATLVQADFRLPCVLAVGSEAHGLSSELARHMQPISIPTANVESLNAAIACSIALFEAQKQRTPHEPI
jgi:RNA methyltransferase, TrmH family